MRYSTAARRRLRNLLIVGVAVASLGAASGCDLTGGTSAFEQPKRGGTLYVNLGGGLELLDPQRTYYATDMNVLRLITRTLTTYRSTPGDNASEIVPDLATDTGRPSESNRVWEFTLKPNVRWQDGEPVTCSQVKYGIERRFSDLSDEEGHSFQEGPPYPRSYLKDNNPPYQGPWINNDNNGKGLESITCLDEHNIRFRLEQPVGDFGYAVALPVFAPVMPEKDTKLDYTNMPYSNGPYKIETWDKSSQLVLVRNNFWSESNDQVRKAYPDKIVFDFRLDDKGTITNELIEDEGRARNTIMLDVNVAPNFLQQVVNDSALVARAVTGPTGAVRYMAINTKIVPNIACRQALIYAFNKRKWRAVSGGSVTGDYATTIIPPGLKSHKDFDLYDSIANPEGNPDKAAAIMDQQAKAKAPCDTTIKVAYLDNPVRRRLMATVVEAYQLAGIQVVTVPLPASTYYSTGVGDTQNDYHMALLGWIPDWANGSAVIPPLFDGRQIPKGSTLNAHTSGNVNFSMVDDEKINEQIDGALAETVPERQAALWGDLDQQIQEMAVSIPIMYERAIRLSGSNVRGGFIHPAFGMPDMCALGLAVP